MLPDIVHQEFFLDGIIICAIILGMLIIYLQHLRKSLKEDEERFRAVSTYTSDWEILLSPDGRPLWINAAAQKISGLTTAEALATPDYPLPLVDKEDQEAVRASLALAKEGGIIDNQLFRGRRPDNSIFHGSLSAQKIFSSKGKLLGCRLSIRNVSALISYQEMMGKKRQLLQSILDNSSDGIIVLNEEFRVIYFNSRFLQLWGLSRIFLNRTPTLQELIHEACRVGLYSLKDEESLIRRRIEQLKGSEVKIHLETLRRDGMLFEAIAAPLPEIGYLLTYRDVTAQTLANREVQRSREHYRSVIETVPHGIIECDLDGRIRYANASYGAIVGIPPELLQHRFFWDALSTPEAAAMIKKRFEQIRKEGHQPGTEVVRLVNSAGGSLWRQVDWNFLREDGGDPSGYIAVVTDITERKTTQIMLDDERFLLNTLIQSLPDPVWLKDLNGKFLACNAAFSSLFNDKPSNIIGRRDNDYVSDELAAFFQEKDRECIATGHPNTHEEWVTYLSDGHRALWETTKTPVFDLHGQAVGALGVARDITERKVIEESLRANERKFRAIFDQAFQFTAILDPEGRVLDANRSALDFIGATCDDIRGKFFWETPWWAGYPIEQRRVRVGISSCAWGNQVRFETTHRGRDDKEREIDFSLKPVRDEWGQIIYLIPEGRDISELKQREKMAMLMARGISAPTGSDFFPALCRSLIEVLGADHAFIGELKGDEIDIVAGISHGMETEAIRYKLAGTPCAQIATTGEEVIFPHKIKTLFPAAPILQNLEVEGYIGRPLCAADGTPLGIMVALYDRPIENLQLIDSPLKIYVARAASELERRLANAVLQESESRYRALFHEFQTIFNGIPDSLTVWSKEPRLLWANSNSSAYYNQPAADLAGKTCRELCRLHFSEVPDCEVYRCFSSQHVEEGVHKTPDGRSWGVKVFPLPNDAGIVDRVIRLASDLTERIVLREEAARAAHLAALGELAAGMAHEINNPTSLILLEMPILQLIFRDSMAILEEHYHLHGDFACGGLRYSRIRDEVPAMISEILDGAERIKQIVEELKDFSHPAETKQFETIDLNEVVKKSVSLVGNQVKKSTAHFSVTYAPTPPISRGSLQRLEQVVINLVINACQAMPDHEGRLSIDVGSWPERRRNFIRITDTGIGILPEHLKLITDPFFTTRRASGGTGLGLSVSTRIIEEHGGSLHFVSQPGEGTVVTVELPATEMEETHA